MSEALFVSFRGTRAFAWLQFLFNAKSELRETSSVSQGRALKSSPCLANRKYQSCITKKVLELHRHEYHMYIDVLSRGAKTS